MMFWLGVPMNFVVGTDLAHMTGKSIVAARRHRALGHVDLKLGMLMVVGTVIGVEGGARLIEVLKTSGQIDLIVGVIYIVILLLISGFTLWESHHALQMVRTDRVMVKDALAFQGVARRVHAIRLPPMISLPVCGIVEISLWVVLGVGVLSGFLAGLLGVGGGFIRMPLLVYVMGVPTHIAVGTDLFEIIFSAGFGTVSHALKGNVDVMMALLMQTGAALGAQIGASLTRFFAGPRIRLLFSGLPLVGAVMVLLRLLGVVGGSP
ncbi:MAG: sulfite exporter TauE/SafE family protein [Anaerolineae bacterium]|nr:MAG: sulfite exporter TauE/SafE family protein [Anaerolineae bacterium]